MSSEPSTRKIEQLIEVLLDGTAKKTVQWAHTNNEDVFRLASETANVLIEKFVHRSENIEDNEVVNRSLRVYNRQGRIVEEYFPSSRQPGQTAKFDSLYETARRSAYKTDDVLDALMMEFSGKTG